MGRKFLFRMILSLLFVAMGVTASFAQTSLYVSSDYNSSTEGYGTTKFSNYAGAYAYATANAKTATIVIEKTNTLSGNTFDNNHKNYSRLAVVIKDGATMGVASSKWDMTYPVTVEPGASLVSARPANAGYINSHIKNTLTIGSDGATKKATLDFLSGSYKEGSIAVLYNGKIVANNADIKIGDLGLTGSATFNNCNIEVDGVLATGKNNFYKQSMTNTKVEITGTNYMNENTYYSTVGTTLNNLTLTNSSIIIDDSNDKTPEPVTIKKLTLVASDVKVYDNANVTISGTVNADGDSALETENIKLDSNGKVMIDGNQATIENNVLYYPVADFSALKAAVEAGKGVKLTADITATGAVDGTDANIDLNGKILTLSVGGNNFFGDSKVKNGSINITGCVASGDCIIGIGDYLKSATLTFDNVNVTGNGYSSAYAVLYVYNSSELNINGGSVVVSNDNASAGGVIKAHKAADGKINIVGTEGNPVELTFNNAKIGMLDGTVLMNYVDLDITGGANAINQSALTIKNSTLDITGADGRALTLSQGNVVVENSTLNFSGCSEGEIRFKKSLELTADDNSTIIECTTYADASATDAKINGVDVDASESSKAFVTVVNGTTTVKEAPKGNDFTGYTGGDAIWGEVWGNARESFVIKVLDANGNVMGTTSLNNVNGIIDGDVNVTWNIKLDAASNTDEYWTMKWTTAPTIDNMPAKVELWVDGVKVSGGNVVLNGPDNLNKIYAAVTDNTGKILAYYTNVQEAIKAAAAVTGVARTATAGTVEFLSDVTVDKWIMFAEKMSIGDGSLITLNINGVTIDGNGKNLTVKSIESAGNGNRLFYDAQNLTVKDLTINIADGLVGGIGLQSGTISNVTFNGGQYGVLPGKNGVTVSGCTFNDTKGYAVYYEDARPDIVVTGNTFNTADGAYAITMRSNEQFTNNTVEKGRVNLANSAKSTVSGNDFGTERFKVYNGATATITGNTINNLVFNDNSVVNSTFGENTLSEDAQAVLDAVSFPVAQIGDVKYATLKGAIAEVEEGQTIEFLAGTIEEGTIKLPATLKNVTFKGAADNTSILKDMTIMASDGNSFSYIGLTFDGIQFDNSRIVFTGWRNGEETIEDLTITNCIVKNLYDDTNMAFLHINKGASEPVKNLTFTNNVLDGVTGGSKSGIYSVNTGKVIIKGNTFNNIVFRPALVQLSDCDGIVDNVEISNNEISNTTRLQVYGTEVDNGDGTYTPTGTDELAVKINNNIFKNISGYYICTWGINGDYDISKNYYDSDNLSEKIYWNNEKPSTVNGLYELGVYPVYTELNDDGTINIESAFTPELNYVAQVGETNYINLADAVEAVKTNGGTLTLLDDVSESLTFNTEDKTPLASPIEIIINLNGKTVTSGESTLWVSDGYVVTVKDETGEGKIITTSGSDEAFAIARGGKIILESGNVVGVGYGVYLYSGGATGEEELVVNGGTIEVPNGGTAIAIGNGKVTVNNGKVICNKTPNGEGWNTYVYENGTLEIKGGEFLGSIGNFGRTSISGGTFSYPDDPNDGFNDEHLAAGYTTEINADGSIKVVALPAAPDGFVWVNNYEQLVAALENDNAKVIMANDIIGDATQSSGYGKAGVVLNVGDILDGNNNKLTINGANTTWDCAVAMLGGEVRNLTISGAFRGVFMPGANGNVLIDNCVFDGVTYTFNSDAGSTDYSVTIKKSELNGWTSFSDVHGSVTFENCIFGEGNDYARCVPYQETTFVGCDFAEGFTVNTEYVEDNDLTFNDCTYAGEPISAENGMDMFYNGGEVLVDGESIDYTRCAQIVRGEETLQFITLQAALNAAVENETITLLIDTELSEMITIPNGKTVVLDLNGKTITGTDNTSKNFSIIDNRGNLTITDSSDPSTGKITLTATIDSDWSRYSAVIANNPGGKLTIEAGTLEHLGGTDMAYGIDNLTNGKDTYAETVINGGYIKSTYRGIRQFLNGVEAQNILTVNGGTIEGANKSIWMQDPNKNANTGTLTVDENATLKGDVYLSATAGSTEWPVEVSIAAAALAEGSEVLTSNLPLGVDVQNINGTYGRVNVVAQIGDVKYQSLAAAVSAAESGATITLMNGEHELPLFANKELTFVGESKDGVIVNDAPAAVTQGWNGSTFHFENLTAKGVTANYHGLANGVVAVTYKDCNINGLRFLYAPTTFEDCAFNAEGVEHSFWTYGASNVTVKNSTFTYTDRAVNCYSENGAEHEADITFEGCSFTYAGTNDTPEGAVEINSGSVKSINLTMNGCTAPEKGAMWFNSKWDSKKGENTVVVVDDVKVWPFAAKIGETGYASLAEALTAAQTANLSDVEITIVGVNTQETADDFNLYEQTVFNNVTIKQDNGNKPYYVKCIYSGKRSIAEGQFVFDGVNVVITEQYITQCKTVLKNNSVVKRTDDAKNFIYYADMFVESGSKYDSQIDDILGGSVTVDGGRTDGTYNTEFDLRSIFFDVRTGQVLTAKNGAYVIFNAANEIGRLTLNGKLSVQASKVEVFNNIPMGDGAVIELDTKSLVSAKVITGAGKIVVDATGFAGEDVEVINADMSGFTGTIEVIGDATYEIVDSKVVIKAPTYVAKVGDDYYATIQAAIDAAKTGDVVVLLEDITLTEADCVAGADRNVLVDVAGKDITLDMNEKKISVTHMDGFTNDYIVAVIRVADGAGLTVTGNGTIEVNVLAENPDIAYMFWKRGTTGHLTILNGTFRMNDAADSMVYTNGNEIVFIKGGNWTLDAYGTRGNREPWIFNVAGAGDNHVLVTGGTFNADINRQFWSNEAVVAETHYTVNNGDGTYTVKEGAEAYVATGMLTGPHFVRKNIGYATLEEAIKAAVDFKDSPVGLNTDVKLEETVIINGNGDKMELVIDLKEHTITGTATAKPTAFRIQNNANVVVKNGNINTENYNFILGASDATSAGNLTIESGKFHGTTSVVSVTKGHLNITGGEFSVEPYQGNYAYLINCIDANYNNETAKVAISGGTFHNWNPENNAAEGANTNFCAQGGYGAVETAAGSNIWEVMPVQKQSLVKGWNWYSTYLDIETADLTGALGSNGVQIKNQDGGKTFYVSQREVWEGSLTLEHDKMYMINVLEACSLQLAADVVDATSYDIELRKGWSWIGYPSNQEIDINTALANFTEPNEGDRIKSQYNGYAEYRWGKWRGTLKTLVPGIGYMYNNKTETVKSFSYNFTPVTTSRGIVEANVTAENNYWTPDATKYPFNMTMTAVVDGLADANYEVAAFVNGEVRGSARPIYVEPMDAYVLFLTIHGEDVEEMSFRLYDIDNDTEYDLSDRINYSNNAEVGSLDNPYTFSRGTTGIGEASMSEVNIYPNPTTTGTEINLEATCDKVEVFNALGVKVAEYQNVDSIDALETAGIYVIRITNNGNVQNCRLVVK